MGLKEQLIQRAKNEENVSEEPSTVEVEETVEESEDNFEMNLEDFFGEDNNQDDQVEELDIDLPSFPADNDEEDFQLPDFGIEETVEEIEEAEEPEPDPIVEEKPKQVVQNSFAQPKKQNNDSSDLKDNLLMKAKATVLADIVENYQSNLLTKEALSNMISSYLSGKTTEYTNSNAVFVAVIDEIINSSYSHDYYESLVSDILCSVKSDLQ